jgi:hypothetical protein
VSETFWSRIRKLFGTAAPPPPARPRASRASTTGPRDPVIRTMDEPTTRPSTTVRWHKERFGPKMKAEWMRRTSARQRVLVALATVSVLALAVFYGARAFVDRRLPTGVTGLWRAESPAYAGHYLELRARSLAWTTGDSAHPVTVQMITRVRHAPHVHGTLYRISYVQDGVESELDVVHDPSQPDALRFANQMNLAWRRDASGRSIYPIM